MCLKFERGESSLFTGFYGIVSQWQVYGKSAKNGVEVLQIFWIYIQENKGKSSSFCQLFEGESSGGILMNKLVNS